MPTILVWCETQSLALKEDPRSNVPEIRMMGCTCGSNRKEVREGSRNI
jgi:hypothetical protein